MTRARRSAPRTAFVLGGGGHLGSCQVGMLRALLEAGVQPDLVLGTSVGAINGAFIAADPTVGAVERLTELWAGFESSGVLRGSVLVRIGTLARTRTHLHALQPLRRLLRTHLHAERIEDLRIPFQCSAASIERAAEHWFASGPLVDAVLASCAVPGVLPPVRVGSEHFYDGGLVNSVPVGRAVQLGAREVYVLQVGRIDAPLRAPRWPWEVGLVAFEIARRHRFAADMAAVPAGVNVRILPTGMPGPRFNDLSQLRYARFSNVGRRMRAAYEASRSALSAWAGQAS